MGRLVHARLTTRASVAVPLRNTVTALQFVVPQSALYVVLSWSGKMTPSKAQTRTVLGLTVFRALFVFFLPGLIEASDTLSPRLLPAVRATDHVASKPSLLSYYAWEYFRDNPSS